MEVFRRMMEAATIRELGYWPLLFDQLRESGEKTVLATIAANQRALRGDPVQAQEFLDAALSSRRSPALIDAVVALGARLDAAASLSGNALHRIIEGDSLTEDSHDAIALLDHVLGKGGRTLLDQGDGDGVTPLMLAVLRRKVPIVRWLLRNRASVDHRDSSGRTALMIAAVHGEPPLVSLLMEAGADPRLIWTRSGYHTLNAAIHGGNFGTARWLLAAGLGAGDADARGRTPLHEAACWGGAAAREFTRLLLERGARVDARDQEGSTPLHFVAAQGSGNPASQIQAAQQLLDAGAAVDARDDDGRTPLMLAAQSAELELVRFLLARGAKADARADDALLGCSVLHAALQLPPDWPRTEADDNRRNDIVHALILAGARVNVADDDGCTPLLLAVDINCRPAYLTLQLAYHGLGIALGERERDLMRLRTVAPLGQQPACKRLYAETLELRRDRARLQGENDRLQARLREMEERIGTLQRKLGDSDLAFAMLSLERDTPNMA